MVSPVGSDRGGDCHLGHDSGAAAADQTAIHQQNLRATPRRLDGRVHAGATCTNHQHISGKMSRQRSPCISSMARIERHCTTA
jgi:hypothetical protein